MSGQYQQGSSTSRAGRTTSSYREPVESAPKGRAAREFEGDYVQAIINCLHELNDSVDMEQEYIIECMTKKHGKINLVKFNEAIEQGVSDGNFIRAFGKDGPIAYSHLVEPILTLAIDYAYDPIPIDEFYDKLLSEYTHITQIPAVEVFKTIRLMTEAGYLRDYGDLSIMINVDIVYSREQENNRDIDTLSHQLTSVAGVNTR